MSGARSESDDPARVKNVRERTKLAVTYALVGVSILFGCAYFGLFPLLLHCLMKLLEDWIPFWYGKAFFMALFFFVALGLFWFRQNERIGYGISEVIGGLVICWYALDSQEPTSIGAALAIGSGIYVMIRGMANTADGIRSPTVQMPGTSESQSSRDPAG